MEIEGDCKSPIVAAIDIGDSYSGYAFSQRTDYEDDPLRMRTNAAWAGNRDLFSIKTPTVVLLKPDGTFHSFGYEAEDHYAEQALDNTHHDWRLFRNFKSALHTPGLVSNPMVEDVSGQAAPLVDILAHSLSYLKDHLVSTVAKSGASEREDIERVIRWVIPIPETIQDMARTLMKNAALKCGFNENRLLMPTETEASLLYCNLALASKEKHLLTEIGPENGFHMLDLGGDTLHSATFKVINNETVEQCHQSCRKNQAAAILITGFIDLFKDIVGKDVFGVFKLRHEGDYIDLLREFEIKKRHTKRDQSDNLTLRVPVSLTNVVQQETQRTHEEVARDCKYSPKVIWLKADRIRLGADMIDELFVKAAADIVSEITAVLAKSTDSKIVLLTGGLADNSQILTDVTSRIHSEHSGVRVMAPDKADAVVMRGAVLYGHCPQPGLISFQNSIEDEPNQMKMTIPIEPASEIHQRKTEEELEVLRLKLESENHVSPKTNVTISASEEVGRKSSIAMESRQSSAVSRSRDNPSMEDNKSPTERQRRGSITILEPRAKSPVIRRQTSFIKVEPRQKKHKKSTKSSACTLL